MLKIAVCDDDEKICNLLENYINDSCRILHIEAETESFISGKVLKRKLREGENYQIYFLDIELADDTGISVSDCIRNEIKDEAAQIVYVSGKDGYDRQLFAFRPFNFIEKPFDQNMVTLLRLKSITGFMGRRMIYFTINMVTICIVPV